VYAAAYRARIELIGRYAIDPSADFSSAQAQVAALAKAGPGEKGRLSTMISVRTEQPQEGKGDKDKRAKDGKKEKRRESSGGGDGKKAKKARTKA